MQSRSIHKSLPPSDTRPKQVAVSVAAPLAGGRPIALGIARFAEEHGGWDLQIGDDLADLQQLRNIAKLIDGLLMCSPTDIQLNAVAEFGKPVVAIATENPMFPRVVMDDHNIGRTAFAHLRSLGLNHFASFGIGDTPFSARRQDGFHAAAGALSARRYAGVVYNTIRADPHEYEKLRGFLTSLPTPCGVFAVTGWVAAIVIREASAFGIASPRDLAVVGVTDDDIACELSRPRITTVDDRSVAAGYEAARMLDAVFRGEKLPLEKPVIVPCGGLVLRASSDVLAVDDPDIRLAVEIIRREALGKLRVADVLARVPVSRRKLERAFSSKLGRSMHDEIVGVRVEEVRRLLKNTDLPMKEIAALCGFSDDSKLSTAFRRATGLTPRDYRRQTSFAGAEPGQLQTYPPHQPSPSNPVPSNPIPSNPVPSPPVRMA